jgi:hypothetical protein
MLPEKRCACNCCNCTTAAPHLEHPLVPLCGNSPIVLRGRRGGWPCIGCIKPSLRDWRVIDCGGLFLERRLVEPRALWSFLRGAGLAWCLRFGRGVWLAFRRALQNGSAWICTQNTAAKKGPRPHYILLVVWAAVSVELCFSPRPAARFLRLLCGLSWHLRASQGASEA